MADEINVVAIVRGYERYIFTYRDSQREQVMRVIRQFAANPELTFSWLDAGALAMKVEAGKPDVIEPR